VSLPPNISVPISSSGRIGETYVYKTAWLTVSATPIVTDAFTVSVLHDLTNDLSTTGLFTSDRFDESADPIRSIPIALITGFADSFSFQTNALVDSASIALTGGLVDSLLLNSRPIIVSEFVQDSLVFETENFVISSGMHQSDSFYRSLSVYDSDLHVSSIIQSLQNKESKFLDDSFILDMTVTFPDR
jgi:hypothetical protein